MVATLKSNWYVFIFDVIHFENVIVSHFKNKLEHFNLFKSLLFLLFRASLLKNDAKEYGFFTSLKKNVFVKFVLTFLTNTVELLYNIYIYI